ncbi:MAG: UDP-N-acetylglucosamine 1-carboxyvinyltransferase [bacterium]
MQFRVNGGKKLHGTISVRGSKNAATPILAATLLTREECILSNIPLIEDVLKMIEIIEELGAKVSWKGERTVSIIARDIDPAKMDFTKVKQMRSSILLMGALAARVERFKMPHPGGCVIGARPVGTHFDALHKLGILIVQDNNFYKVNAKNAHSGEVVLREFSVTATENVLMLAATFQEKTVIKIAATEPHVQDLCRFLRKLGVKIRGIGTHTLEIVGRKDLGGTTHTIIPDANEAATFLIMGVAAKSPIIVQNAVEDHLTLVLEKLREFGADFDITGHSITVKPVPVLKAVSKIDARIYPGIPTDIQAPMGVLATQAEGTTLIHDTLYEGRFKYINELQRMGANAVISDPHRALITGPTPLYGKEVVSFDLRAGATMIIAALIAEGQTVINDAHQVDRGYERIEERLQAIGADIERV